MKSPPPLHHSLARQDPGGKGKRGVLLFNAALKPPPTQGAQKDLLTLSFQSDWPSRLFLGTPGKLGRGRVDRSAVLDCSFLGNSPQLLQEYEQENKCFLGCARLQCQRNAVPELTENYLRASPMPSNTYTGPEFNEQSGRVCLMMSLHILENFRNTKYSCLESFVFHLGFQGYVSCQKIWNRFSHKLMF